MIPLLSAGYKRHSAVVAVCGCFLVFAARADVPLPAGDFSDPGVLKKLSLEELAQIEVTTPSKAPVSAFDSPSAVFVITGEDIRRSGATSIPEALRLAPGVEVARIDANHWSIGIRGFGTRLTRSVLVLIDGRTVFTPLFDGTYWEVQDTLLEDVDRIEVVRGPGATVWGPNAVNGVINVVTKSAGETHGTFVSLGGGNEEQGFLNARYGGGNGKNFNYRFYGKAFTRDAELHPDNAYFDDWRSIQGGFRMDWSDTGRGAFTLQGDIYREEAGERVQAGAYTPPYQYNIDDNEFLSGGNILARWQRSLSQRNDVQVQFYYDRTNRHEPNLGELRNTFDVDFLQNVQLGRHKVSWGLGARFEPVRDIQVVTGLTFLPAERADYLLTAFLQDEIQLVRDRLTLTLGAKALHTNFTHGIGYEPSIRLAWTPDAKQTVWAAFTHALRTPSDVEENFYLSGLVGILPDGTPWLGRFNANSNFATEQMNGYELGYRRLFGKHVLTDISSYFNHYHNLFDQEITGGIFFEDGAPGVTGPVVPHIMLPLQFGNGLLAYTKGIEVSPEWRPTASWRLRGSYSYLHMNVYKAPDSADIGTAAGIQGASPEHQVYIQSELDVSKKIQLDLTWRHVSRLLAGPVPAYSTADARIGWRFTPGLELSIAGRNLLQPSHIEDAGDPGPLVGIERSGYAQLTWRR
ncbi:MAG TPA: TonB-dependent receptor [Bryobacteraceae bacterium]|nr:TonB-dependent receptor [Bryobacteraceae bacterium]